MFGLEMIITHISYALLVILHQYFNPHPLELWKLSSIRHHSASIGSITPDNPDHKSFTKPTQLSQPIKMCFLCFNHLIQLCSLALKGLDALVWVSWWGILEGPTNILCKPLLSFSSSEDEPLLLPLSPKPLFKSSKATALTQRSVRKQNMLKIIKLISSLGYSSKHCLDMLSTQHQAKLKPIYKRFVVGLQRISTELRTKLTKNQAQLVHKLQPTHNKYQLKYLFSLVTSKLKPLVLHLHFPDHPVPVWLLFKCLALLLICLIHKPEFNNPKIQQNQLITFIYKFMWTFYIVSLSTVTVLLILIEKCQKYFFSFIVIFCLEIHDYFIIIGYLYVSIIIFIFQNFMLRDHLEFNTSCTHIAPTKTTDKKKNYKQQEKKPLLCK
ncbi:putative signal peptide protein [Puccinia sorghi]|uniref:Putative signal peptide protein n=1 Tax=Puccinia sorghi TaxID=27349 RepID=A0A0L6UNT3_9BASI|nr:putative signal peptide protein [Puccinia sorghi]